MKKVICFIAFALVYFGSVAQTFPQNPTNGQVQINNTNLGGGTFNRGVRGGVFVDTSAANDVLYMKGTKFMLISTTSDNNYWYRSADTMRWELIATTTSNCAGTQLISGSITWSGSGLVYDATDLDYYILCSRYFANSTTLTLAVADPTYGRIDKFYADNTQNIGVITGTPSANPQEPSVNPLTQIDLGFVYIPAGSTVPAGTTQTVIYNENVEWTGTSDVPSINFAYATNPYIGSLSTYIPSAPNDSYISWQYGTTKRFIDVQYLKLWVRINEAFVSRPSPFLDVSFYNGSTKVSADSYVEDGVYNFDFNLIGEWQLVSIPLQGLVVSDSIFDKVNFVIHSAPTSFQLDYVYLLETATIPPAPVGGTWLLNGNSAINDVTQYIGTRDAKKLNFGTNGQIRAYIDTAGIELLGDTTANVMLIDSNGKIWKTYQPTILADSPLVIYTDVYQDRIKADTTDATPTALATQYDILQKWGINGNDDIIAETNFIGTKNDVDLVFKRNNFKAGRVNTSYTAFGYRSLDSIVSGINTAYGAFSLRSNSTGSFNTGIGTGAIISNKTGNYNTGLGYAVMNGNIGSYNTGVGARALFSSTGSNNTGIGNAVGRNISTGVKNTAIGDSALLSLGTGSYNTAIGANADVTSGGVDSAIAIGYQASAGTKQLAFSPHVTTMFLDLDSASGTAPAIAGIDENGNWRKYATPAGGSSQWTDTTAGIYYADKVGIGGVMNPDSTLVVVGSATVSNSLIVGTSISNSGIGSIVSGINNTVGTGMNNIVVGVGHNVANNQGANSVFGEVQTMGNSEASTIINGFGNIVGDGANDALVGGTGSSTFASSTIAIGLGNETNAVESISIGGGGNAANGIYSGTFAGTSHEAEDSAAVAIGGQNNSVGGVNAAILGGENNFTSGRNTVVLGGNGISGTMANTTYVDSLRVGGKIVAPNLPTSGTYSKSLAIDASGNIYKKDTLAVSGVYAPLASPTFTGTVNLPATTFNGILSSTFNGSFNNMTLLGGLATPKTITAGGTTGAQTINKPTGSVNFAAGATTLVVTNSYVSSTSLVIVQVYGTDVTATTARVTLAAGSFTITLNAAATAETKVGFFVTN